MLLAGCASAVVHIYGDIAKLLIIYCYCLCAIISLHPPSYNIERCGFCVIICYLSDDILSLLHETDINLLPCLSVWAIVLLLIFLHVFSLC